MPFVATPFRTDRPVLHFNAVVSTAVLCAIRLSVEVDPIKLSQNIYSFDHSSVNCDCWHRFVCCSVVKSVPQCLCLVWTDERSGVVALGYVIQLLLHCFGCLLGVPLVDFFWFCLFVCLFVCFRLFD